MPNIIASEVLANGLRTEFTETYTAIRNRQADGRLGQVMDLNIGATNRYHDFAFFESGPHITLWRRGEPVPGDAMGSDTFRAVVWDWARRVKWHKHDRADDQTQSLMTAARMAGESTALLPERTFFDVLTNGASNYVDALPAIPLAPDGQAFFSTTSDGGSTARFGATNGNLLTGTGVTTIHDVQADYYSALIQFGLFQDGKGQPLFSPEIIDQGAIIIHALADTEIFDIAFKQTQNVVGLDNTGARGGTVVYGGGESNLIQDTNRTPTLWGTSRLASGDWYVFLRNPPQKAVFRLERQGVIELEALEGNNNSDHVRDTGEEYVQWECREGVGLSTPYSVIMIDNS
jgi:hypothetical protein